MLKILGPLPRGTILDCPAGEGALAEDLVAEGFHVRCCDLYSEIFRLDGVEIKRGDLAGTLPYPSRAFDYICSLDGLEHIDSPPQAFREYRRLLKPSGHLIISVPNIMNIEERLKWLLFGYTSRHSQKRSRFFVLPAIVAISFFLIADIDSPRGGVIRVRPQNLEAVASTMTP